MVKAEGIKSIKEKLKMKNKYLIYFLIFICFFWLLYPLIEKESITLFLLNSLASPAGIFICYESIKNKKKFNIYKNIIFYYFLAYGLFFLSIDIYNILNKNMLVTDFGLTSDIVVIYCAIKLKYMGLFTK